MYFFLRKKVPKNSCNGFELDSLALQMLQLTDRLGLEQEVREKDKRSVYFGLEFTPARVSKKNYCKVGV
jgi:hypothetical protein